MALHHSVKRAFVQPGEARALANATFGGSEDVLEIFVLEAVQDLLARVRERLSQEGVPFGRGSVSGRRRLVGVERPAFVAAQIGDTNLGSRGEQDGPFDDAS